jgi:serine/threonine protein kinase
MVGSLKSVLLDHSQVLPWETRLSFANDCASGMRYLHEKGAVHRGIRHSFRRPRPRLQMPRLNYLSLGQKWAEMREVFHNLQTTVTSRRHR